MPTNLLRNMRAPPVRSTGRQNQLPADAERVAVLTIGDRRIRLTLASSLTADLIWRALPLYATAETWGDSLHFEIPVHAGRDRTAVINGQLGLVYFWTEEQRILLPFGPTPISRAGQCRLPSPANVWAASLDDVGRLAGIEPGEKVGLLAAANLPTA